MTQPSSIAIKEGDFKSLEVRVTFKNRTSNFTTSKLDHAVVREFHERGATFDVPLKFCAVGHTLDLEFVVINCDAPVSMEAAAKVTMHEILDRESQSITVEFFTFSEQEWSKLQEVYSSKQLEVLELLQNIRGY